MSAGRTVEVDGSDADSIVLTGFRAEKASSVDVRASCAKVRESEFDGTLILRRGAEVISSKATKVGFNGLYATTPSEITTGGCELGYPLGNLGKLIGLPLRLRRT
ncbi:MAG: hypothetical protein EBZ48_07930 [Proteobacteria bacterium]|nr:hypothetical protein [Pseudomonadota bacterium]